MMSCKEKVCQSVSYFNHGIRNFTAVLSVTYQCQDTMIYSCFHCDRMDPALGSPVLGSPKSRFESQTLSFQENFHSLLAGEKQAGDSAEFYAFGYIPKHFAVPGCAGPSRPA